MHTLTRTGGLYADALPSGEWVVTFVDRCETHLGVLQPLPDGQDFLMFVRCTGGTGSIGGFRFAAKDHSSDAGHEWTPHTGWTGLPTFGPGNNPVIYDNAGLLHITDGSVGTQGYRFVDATGRIWTGDETYFDPISDLSEWSDYGGFRIGQGHGAVRPGGGVQVWDGTVARWLDQGTCTFIRVQGSGENVAISYVRPEGCVISWTTLSELRLLPPINVAAPEPPIGPTTPPRTDDGRLYDLLSFVASDSTLQPRTGPTHPQYQLDRVSPTLTYFIKFDDPHAYELWAHDANWIYHLEDASGRPAYSLSDPRWFPRQLPIGEAHAFVTGPHESVYRTVSCSESRRDPIDRKMWLHAVYDGWQWGTDLGIRPTIVAVYDPTAGIHSASRSVELYYFAEGAGWCRWEAYRSDLVYASGTATFTDAARVARSDFYHVGGRNLEPIPTGCVPEQVPSYPPLSGSTPPQPEPGAPMHIYVNIGPGNVAVEGDIVDHGNGTISVQDGGQYLSRDSGGNWHWSPAMGPDETFIKCASALVSINEFQTKTIQMVPYQVRP
jgi:hypothetical protein